MSPRPWIGHKMNHRFGISVSLIEESILILWPFDSSTFKTVVGVENFISFQL